ncbi:HEAT repeat domain-containing protein [Neolewinella lacunae]|uniref:HEAT repeat domain-containing protein n=1 Tax=Neolewinella lacunae TaxID=1517758 RepID=A0A923PKF7_9BACT|nr:HEAT repeat domain-containing protein [Neolewinella lacunae]MBC6995732.1 HEAT repeat domain-containing protein [Neolewinella lacunae]MDN3636575.1 HEAT repeat domain-containing protein [Neolewinella lacunae]
MKTVLARLLGLAIIITGLAYACSPTPEITDKYPALAIEIDPATAASEAGKLRSEASVVLADGFDLSVWAADSLVTDPIAISVAPDGRIFYTSATRQENSEFDIRGHSNWMTASISFQSVEDRRAFLRETFSADSDESELHLKDLNGDGVKDWRDLTVEKEQVWFLTDQTGDGVADRAQRYLSDFGEEITDVANGVEFHDGEVYVAVGPDLWRTQDRNKNGIADQTESISHGYAVHVGFSGHGMSGVTVGPQGRIWWGIGDIGANVVDKSGKEWKYPNRGVVVRCDPDGSNFEVFAMGVRNTHEFAFDQFGNLITVDNDGDHPGERERLVYLIDGSDSGWRINWQFGKYTDPTNNDYKVWMNEGMYLPRHAEQAAYFLPPIQNFVNGPTGLVYNPGTALSPAWYDHFFVAEFRGSPSNSPIHAFQMKPDGAGFALAKTQEVVQGLLPTGLDFGPDGALYFGDWINGWGTKDAGRIWKLDMGAAAGAEMAKREEVKALLNEDFATKEDQALADLLGHQDQRIRRNAQFALAKRGEEGFAALQKMATGSTSQLARIHAIWGMAQMQRLGYAGGTALHPFLADKDPEIVAQAAKMIGDLRDGSANEPLIGLLGHTSPRVRFFAMEALGRTASGEGVAPILAMLRADGGQDSWLRHGGMVALGRIGDAAALTALTTDTSRALRTIAVVALRRMNSPEIAKFLNDADEYVVAEAARGINDDFQIPEAMGALAQVLGKVEWQSEALVRRAINANLNVGEKANVDLLVAYANNPAAPAILRAEALATLAHWAEPSLFDRVDGRYRGPRKRDATYVQEKLGGGIASLIASGDEATRAAAIQAAAILQIASTTEQLTALVTKDRSANIRSVALVALDKLKAPDLENLLRAAMNDRDSGVRAQALSLLPQSSIDPDKAVGLYAEIIEKGSTQEAQAALTGLGKLSVEGAATYLGTLVEKMESGKLAPALHLDLIETIEAREGSPALRAQLDAYAAKKTAEDDLGLFASALVGGDARTGQRIFMRNATAQCTRCHAIFEYGGNVGPGLEGVGSRLSPREILTSIIRPSAALSPGHETVLVTLKDQTALSGIVLERTPAHLKVKTGKTDIRTIPREDIAEEETLPSSMPSVEGKLSKREIRDLVAFLVTVKGEES